MIVSQARIDANRLNAQMSTGPVTATGKRNSRANALKHGLCSLTVVAESPELIRARTLAFVEQFQPEGEYELWLAEQAALASIRIERCQAMERAVRDKVAIRAEVCWGDDLKLEAVKLGQSIARAPEAVVEQLRQSPQGCEWLIGRWAMLAHSADLKKGWTPEQAQLAFDLLGTPGAFRDGCKPGASIDSMGRMLDPANDPASVARRMAAELEGRRELLGGLDEARQALAMADLDDEADPELKRLRRHEATLQRRLRWCLGQLEDPAMPDASPPPRDASTVRIGPDEPPAQEPSPEPVPSISTSAEIDALIAAGRFSNIDLPYGVKPFGFPTLDQFIDRSESPVDRADRKLQKAEARRDARRRKLEKART
jgi:hypothetical protein